MYRDSRKRILTYMKTSLVLMDVICSNMAFIAAFLFSRLYWAASMQEAVLSDVYSVWVLFNLVALVAALHLRLYANSTIERLENVLRATWKSVITFLPVFIGCTLVEHRFYGVGYFLGALAGLVIAYVVLSRFLFAYVYTALSRRHATAFHKK